MRPIAIAAVVVASVSAVAGCSSETVAGAPTTSTAASSASGASFCDAYCQKVNECDTSSDL